MRSGNLLAVLVCVIVAGLTDGFASAFNYGAAAGNALVFIDSKKLTQRSVGRLPKITNKGRTMKQKHTEKSDKICGSTELTGYTQ